MILELGLFGAGIGLLGVGTVLGGIVGFILKQKKLEHELKDWKLRYQKREMTWRGDLGNRAMKEEKQQFADLCSSVAKIYEQPDLKSDEKNKKAMMCVLGNPVAQSKLLRIVNNLPKLLTNKESEEDEGEGDDEPLLLKKKN